MRIKLLVLAIAAAALAAFSVAVPASAKAPGTTKVTIKANDFSFYGEVKSNKNKCENGRKVVLFKVKAGKDQKVGSDFAQAEGDGYMWSVNTEGNGDHYAKAKNVSGCDPGKSRAIPAQ